GRELLGVERFRQRNDLGQKVDLFIEAWPAAEEHVDDLVEIEQPERQLEIARIEDLRAVAEAAAIFIVDVENEKPQVGARLDDLLQQQGNRARLADTGGAEHGKMLAHHFVDVEAGGGGPPRGHGAPRDSSAAGG